VPVPVAKSEGRWVRPAPIEADGRPGVASGVALRLASRSRAEIECWPCTHEKYDVAGPRARGERRALASERALEASPA
jgi:hypothetical protein